MEKEQTKPVPDKTSRPPASPIPRQWGWLVLLASSTTLICCALPILLVSLGLGAVVAALFATVPGLTWLALNKAWLFAGSGLLLVVAAWSLYRPGRACPTDPERAALCESAWRWNRRILLVSALVWATGFFAAYLLLPLTLYFE